MAARSLTIWIWLVCGTICVCRLEFWLIARSALLSLFLLVHGCVFGWAGDEDRWLVALSRMATCLRRVCLRLGGEDFPLRRYLDGGVFAEVESEAAALLPHLEAACALCCGVWRVCRQVLYFELQDPGRKMGPFRF